MPLTQVAEVINGGITRAAPTDVRFDGMLLSPHISDAEARFVIPVLTEDFYDVLLGAKSASASNYNASLGPTAVGFSDPAYEALWTSHLRDYCGTAILYEALPFIGVQIQSGGLYQHNTEYGASVGIDGVKFMQDTLLAKLELKRERLRSYLCTCAAALTGFSPSAAGCPSSACDEDPEGYSVDKFHGMIFY